jgi:hypothetical protein
MSTTFLGILDQILGSITESLTPELAERILQFRLDAETQSRIEVLAEKANEGLLSEDERAEYLEYIEAMDWVGILKAKACAVLGRPVK